MVVPVNNPSKVTRKRTKLKKKQNNNLGAAPAKLEDEGGQGKASSDFKIQGMIRKARNSTKASAPKPVKGPKAAQSISSTSGVGVKGKSKAKPFIEDEGGQGRASSDYKTQGMIRKARNSTKASAPKPVGRKTTDAGGASPKRKAPEIVGPKAGKTPKPIPKPKPVGRKTTDAGTSDWLKKKAPVIVGPAAGKTPKPISTGRDKDLFGTPTGVTSGRVKSDPTEGGRYAFTPKGSKSLMGMTQEGYDEIMNDSSGEKAGGRPGRGKLKTQGMNKKGKRKAGFSGKGAGAALRGF